MADANPEKKQSCREFTPTSHRLKANERFSAASGDYNHAVVDAFQCQARILAGSPEDLRYESGA
jgi:hypothetical protein